MNIDTRVQDNRLFSGIKFYDGMPLNSRDLHEMEDAASIKMKHLLNNIIGYGMINEPTFSFDSTGNLCTDVPITILVDGDICQVSGGPILIPKAMWDTYKASATAGTQYCMIIGWYHPILADSKVYRYGGVYNSTLDNDILDPTFKVQATSRYQFRWAPCLVTAEGKIEDYETLQISYPTQSEDDTYNWNNLSDEVTFTKVSDGLGYISDTGMYAIPVCSVNISGGEVSQDTLASVLPTMPKGSSLFIKQTTEPEGTYTEGTIWYNPDTKKFKTYITDVGFVENAPDMYIKDEVLVNQEIALTDESPKFDTQVDILPLYSSKPINPNYLVFIDGVLLTERIHYEVTEDRWDFATGIGSLAITIKFLDFTAGTYELLIRCQSVEKA